MFPRGDGMAPPIHSARLDAIPARIDDDPAIIRACDGIEIPQAGDQVQVHGGGRPEDTLQRCLVGGVVLDLGHQEAAALARIVRDDDLGPDRQFLQIPEDGGAILSS